MDEDGQDVSTDHEATDGASGGWPEWSDPEASDHDSASSRQSGKGQANDRARRNLLRKAVRRTVDIAALSEDRRAVLAAALAVTDSSDIVSVAQQSLEAGRAEKDTLATLTRIASASALEAGAAATELAMGSPKRFRAVWTVLAALAPVPAVPPSQAVKAGLALAEATQKLKDKDRQNLDEVVELIG